MTFTDAGIAARMATADDRRWIPDVEPGATATVTFDEPGTYTYATHLHPHMTATIAVTDHEAPGERDRGGGRRAVVRQWAAASVCRDGERDR